MKRMQATLVCAAMAFFLAACGGSEEPSGGGGKQGGGNGGAGGGQQEETLSQAAIEEQYAQGQYTLTEDGADDGQYADAAPEDLPFPLPPEAEIIAAGQSEEQAYAVAMNVPSGEEAYEFYLQSLPDAGFEIVSERRADEQGREGENAEDENAEGENAEGEGGGDAAPEDAPFSGTLVVEGNDLRGSMRFDEERAIIGMSAAALQNAAEVEAEEEAGGDAPEETAPEGDTPGEEAPDQ